MTEGYENIVAGIPYCASFLSTKLAYGALHGSALNQIKRADHLGLVLQNTHCQALQYGPYNLNPVRLVGANALWDSAPPLDSMPLVEKGEVVTSDTIWAFYDNIQFEWNGNADTDARIYIHACSPRPATVVALTIGMDSNG